MAHINDARSTQPAISAAAPVARILLGTDDPELRQRLGTTLREAGYLVATAADHATLPELLHSYQPDLLLAALPLLQADDLALIRQLRSDVRTSQLPVLGLAAPPLPLDLAVSFAAGIDDVLVVSRPPAELLVQIQAHLIRAARQVADSSLAGQPGMNWLLTKVSQRIDHDLPFALIYADMDHFNVFNEAYGIVRGDAAIRTLAALLQEAIARHGSSEDCLSYMGGDDFALLTTPERAEPISRYAVAAFEDRIRTLYDPRDARAGSLLGLDAAGMLRRFPLMTLSIAVVSTSQRSFSSREEVGRAVAETSQKVKALPGSNYAVALPAAEVSGATRGAEIVLLDPERTLLQTLQRVFHQPGYRLHHAATPAAARALLAAATQPALLIVDVWQAAELAALLPETDIRHPAIVIATAGELPRAELPAGVVWLAAPFSTTALLARAERLLSAARAGADWPAHRDAPIDPATPPEAIDSHTVQLIDYLRQQVEVFKRQAIHDPLTDLVNRRYLDAEFAREWELARSQGRDLTVVIADIDDFKQVNDRFSHLVGNEVLKQVAELITATCRSTDIVARYGGEEFVLLLPGTTAERAATVCEKIRQAVEIFDWSTIHSAIRVTISMGLSDDLSGPTPEAMLALADARLYQAKRSGKNRICR